MELATRLGVGRQRMYVLLQKGEIPGAKLIGGRWRIHIATVDKWLKETT